MPWIKVWLHFVWSTKNPSPYLHDDIRGRIFDHIRQNAREKLIHIDFINGHLDHVHALISLLANQSLDKIMQLIKGESSFWINKNNLTKSKFGWQDEYFVASVSPSAVPAVRKYIANQPIHHAGVSFEDEINDLMLRAGFQRFKDSWR